MSFFPQPKGYFVEQSEQGWLLARTSGSTTLPIVVEALREVSDTESAGLPEIVRDFAHAKTPSGYLQAICGVMPPSRLVRRAPLESKRCKDVGYLNDLVSSQFRVEPEKYALALLHPGEGSEYDGTKGGQKDALFCGALHSELDSLQDQFLENGVYPERMELSTLASLGGLVNYIQYRNIKDPVLTLELGRDATQSFILSAGGIEVSRPISLGLDSMIPIVQKELSLKDEEAARKLFHSNTFDFTGMGPQLTRRLVKELQASIGFYEVQTGQSISGLICLGLPPKLGWLEGAFAQALGVGPIKIELVEWLAARQVTLSPQAASAAIGPNWLGLFCLMLQHHASPAEEKK